MCLIISMDEIRAARSVGLRIQKMISLLSDKPYAGSATNRPGMRRIIAFPYPYAIFYRVSDDEIVIHGVRLGN
jgi:toxin ParE1/3/4